VSHRSLIAQLRAELLTRRSLQVALFIVILAGSLALLLLAHKRLETTDFTRHGYLGVFVVNLVTCASILFPIPGEAINIAASALLNPLIVALVATAGGTIGEMTAYLAGMFGRQILVDRYAEGYAHAERWMNRYGVFAVFLFAVVPMLIYDFLGLVAGGTRYDITKFVGATFAGRFVRCLVFSYSGYALFDLARLF